MDGTHEAAALPAPRHSCRSPGAQRGAGRVGAGVITHPEKVMFPDCGITKGELAEYYELVAPLMVPHLAGRPITLKRLHKGIGEKGFFQKYVSKGAPDWLQRIAVPKTDGVVNYANKADAR